MTTPRVVLFGGHGFVGSALRRGLPHEVVAPSRREVDLLDTAAVQGLLRPGDVVVNAAGYAQVTDRGPGAAARFRRENVSAVSSLAVAAAGADVAQLIHVSSVAAMGHREGARLREDDLTTPRNQYGQSKRDGELVLAQQPAAMPVTILRGTSVIGEGRSLAALLCRLATLPIVPLPRRGQALIPLSYVDNLVEAVRLSIGNPATFGRTFIVGDQESYPLRRIVDELASALSRPAPRVLTVPVRALHAASAIEGVVRRVIGGPPILDPIRVETLTCSVSYSIDAFREATGYAPPVGLTVAAQRVADWYSGRAQ